MDVLESNKDYITSNGDRQEAAILSSVAGYSGAVPERAAE